MPTKIYTAQEMREAADAFADADRPYWFSREGWREIVAILRYAADMRERCEELLQKLRPYRDEDVIGTLNYILRGDAGKEGK